MTRKERLEVYEHMLKLAKKDLRDSLESDCSMFGLCHFATLAHSNINLLPELIAQRPTITMRYDDAYWWNDDPKSEDSNKRIEAIEKAIAEVKKHIKT